MRERKWNAYLVSSWRKVIKSLRSLGFLRPPKAILVPGMYFLGFSRYSNCRGVSDQFFFELVKKQTYKSTLVPGDALLLVGVGVRETVDLASLAAEETV